MGKIKLNIPMLAALILLLLTMISAHMLSGLYARYSSTVSASDSASVAKFDVKYADVQVQDNVCTFSVINDSEVTVAYSIDVALDPNLSATIGGQTKSLASGESFVRFTDDSWVLPPDTDSAPITLELSVTGWPGPTDLNTPKTEQTVNFNFAVSVNAEQVD